MILGTPTREDFVKNSSASKTRYFNLLTFVLAFAFLVATAWQFRRISSIEEKSIERALEISHAMHVLTTLIDRIGEITVAAKFEEQTKEEFNRSKENLSSSYSQARAFTLSLAVIRPKIPENLQNRYDELLEQTAAGIDRLNQIAQDQILAGQQMQWKKSIRRASEQAQVQFELSSRLRNFKLDLINEDNAARIREVEELKDIRKYLVGGILCFLAAFGLIGIQMYSRIKKLAKARKDISELAEENKYYRLAIDQSALFEIVDTEGVFVFLNQNSASTYGYSKEELIGKKLRIIDSDYHDMNFYSEMYKKIARGHIWKGVTKNKTKEGHFIWLDTTIIPQTNNRKVLCYIIIRFDVTAAKNAQDALHEERNRQVQSSKMSVLGEMAAGMAHEINNPLAIIKLRSEQIVDEIETQPTDTELIIKLAKQIDSVVDRIAKIIKGLRQYARDGTKDPFETTSIDQLIEDTLDLCSTKFSEKGIRFSFAKSKTGVLIKCRASQISQVLLNMLSNSIDAIETVSAAKDKWVSVEVLEEPNQMVIAITDSGTGIPKELQEKILQPFFTTKPIGKGTGLGLSISLGIIKDHEGVLKLDTDHPNTRFLIVLPKAQVDQLGSAA